ncbi:hypothetical protein [Abyssogena phaseoliformis symbiont]|nr:hypothetical protein [Abyssogena phaseoliformis symbiont]
MLSYQAGDTLSNFLSITDASSSGDVVINIDTNDR